MKALVLIWNIRPGPGSMKSRRFVSALTHSGRAIASFRNMTDAEKFAAQWIEANA